MFDLASCLNVATETFVDQLCNDTLFLINSVDFGVLFSDELSQALEQRKVLCYQICLLLLKWTRFLAYFSSLFSSLPGEFCHQLKMPVSML